jgi:hypothetical protein
MPKGNLEMMLATEIQKNVIKHIKTQENGAAVRGD